MEMLEDGELTIQTIAMLMNIAMRIIEEKKFTILFDNDKTKCENFCFEASVDYLVMSIEKGLKDNYGEDNFTNYLFYRLLIRCMEKYKI